MFIGRRSELEILERAYASRDSGFIPIYGRRRVGKSELILHFLEGKRGLYFLGKTAPPALQLRELLQEAAQALEEPLLASYSAPGWKETLQSVVERWKGEGKLVLVLDEFQWMCSASPELPSVIQELWDRRWKRTGKLLLILCGSVVGFMERTVLGRSSPLFGRTTAQIHLRPFGYREAAEFLPSWSRMNQALAYFLVGGAPLYLRALDPRASVETNIEERLLTEYSPLFREPEFLLREELREVENYYAVLLAIAAGQRTVRAIAQRAAIPERSLPYYIEQLISLGYVARRQPLTGTRPARTDVRYEIGDALLRFWFRFVFPNVSSLQQMGPKRTLRERIGPELEAYAGTCFERLCREALPRLYEREGVNAAFQIGEYWNKEIQIDIVGLRDDGWTDLGECKWASVRSYTKVLGELRAKIGRFPNRRGATLGPRLFLRRGPKAPLPDEQRSLVRCHTLDDLYA
ncbi:MAG TPA: ATP-binding protein [Anaeromyxobacteraceae bacterium]|nr:ATP-binding protein [Anaeromyxobacteraceae bacterium]